MRMVVKEATIVEKQRLFIVSRLVALDGGALWPCRQAKFGVTERKSADSGLCSLIFTLGNRLG